MDYKIETTATGYLVSVAGVGAQGADGQSAYLSAVEGGYTGSEAEFYALLGNFEQYASDVQDAATTATDAATSAGNSASTANSRATAAATSATAAASSATAAATSASTANTAALSADSSKTAAASSATSAATSANAAATARTEAETARTIATDSAAAAATSATSASTSATSAATSASNANTYKAAAEQAKTDAQNYASAAAASASAASTAASTATTKASDSTNAAQAALNYAAASGTNATTAINKAAEATAAANTASTAATTATTKASEAATSANTASTAATTATNIANTIGVSNASIDGAGHLIITRNNGSTIDAGTAKGDKGDKGDAGTGLKLKGTLPDVGSLPSSGNTEGDAWLISPNIWIYGASGWVNGGPIQGEKGDKGDKGDTGDQGIQGIQGTKGDKGDTGGNGTAATIAVGTVTTGAPGSSAIVTNVGTSFAAVFDLTIPRGDPGTGDVVGPAASVDNEVALFDGDTGKVIKGGGVLGTGAYAEEDRWKLQAFNVVAVTYDPGIPSWALGSYYPQSDALADNGHTAIHAISGDIYTMTDGVWVLTNPFDANSNGSRIAFAQIGDAGPFLWTRTGDVTTRTAMFQGSGNIRYSEGTAGVDFANYTVRSKLNEIGRLINLTTTDKASIVAAINELVSSKLGDAPSDGETYGRKDEGWMKVAPIDSPTFTGTPAAPTAAVGTDTTQIATTAYVFAERAATATLTNKTITTPIITGTREVRVAMPANAIDLATGNLFTKTISGATTLTVSNVPTAGTAVSFILELTNAGSAAITWFSGVKWAGGAAPALTASGVDVLGFYSHNGGTTWRGMVLAKDSK